MITRRSLLTGTALAGAVSAGIGGAGRTAGPAVPREVEARASDEDTAKALGEIRDLLKSWTCAPGSCPEVEAIRAQQKVHVKSRGKFPDFIEIGIDVWEKVYDWHVKTRQAPEISRQADGRYAMAFMQTLLVLRHDVAANYIGLPYDGK